MHGRPCAATTVAMTARVMQTVQGCCVWERERYGRQGERQTAARRRLELEPREPRWRRAPPCVLASDDLCGRGAAVEPKFMRATSLSRDTSGLAAEVGGTARQAAAKGSDPQKVSVESAESHLGDGVASLSDSDSGEATVVGDDVAEDRVLHGTASTRASCARSATAS